MSKVQLIIDREFRDLCPSSSFEELGLLEESIKAEGCREPIYYWANGKNEILDGHQRFTLCTRLKKTYEMRPINLPDRDACEVWILRNQLCRRNLTDAARSIARGKLYNRIKGKQGGDHLTPHKWRPKGQNVPLLNAAETIASQDGVDAKTVKRDGKLAEAIEQLPASVVKAIEQGEIPMKHAAALAELPNAEQQKKAAKVIANGEAKSVAEAMGTKPPKQKPVATAADKTKAQIKLWYDAVARWLGQSPSIDEYRAAFPGKHGDRVLNAAKELYEAMKAWHGVIK